MNATSRAPSRPARPRRFDLFALRYKYARLGGLVDAEYGSATFVDVRLPAVLEVSVSTTGLLVRRSGRKHREGPRSN